MQKIKIFIKNRTKLQIISVVVVLFVVIFVLTSGGDKFVEVEVERGEVLQEVVATGKVKSVEDVDLGFETSGKIAQVYTPLGSSVAMGDLVVMLDQNELLADLKRAKALLNESLVTLEKVKRTSSTSYDSSYAKALVALTNAYTETRDSVYNTADRFFYNPLSSSPSLDIYYYSNSYKYQFSTTYETSSALSVERSNLNDLFQKWEASIDAVRNTETDLTSTFNQTETNIEIVKKFLTNLATVMNAISQNNQEQEVIISGYRNDVASVRSAINTSQGKLLDAKEVYLSSPRQSTGGSGIGYDSVLEQQAKVDVAYAEVESLEAKLAKTVLRSPIDGIVTKQEAKVGEIVTSGTELVSIISNKKFEVEADISEINIGKIRSGNQAEIILDAFPNNSLIGFVSYIEPGEKIVDGVVNYEIRVVFSENIDLNLKSGLTASLYILTDRKDGVLKLPTYAVKRKEDGRFVSLKTQGGVEDREVETGLFGKDGVVEIILGVEEGDIVLVDENLVK